MSFTPPFGWSSETDPILKKIGEAATQAVDEGLAVAIAAVEAAAQQATQDYTSVKTTQDSAQLRKNNLVAGRAPLPTDDTVQGYAVGSRWLWQGREWVATGVVQGAARWASKDAGLPVQMFGAVGDEVADDLTGLTAAAALGELIRLAKPVVGYKVSAPITLPSRVMADPTVPWSKLTDNGRIDFVGGKVTNGGATIHRFADRVFIGRAAAKFAGDNGTEDSGTSFFSKNANGPAYLAINSALLVEASPCQYAITGAVRTSDATGAAGIALGSAVVNDRAGGRAWGWIAEMQHEVGALNSNGFELAIKNKSGVSTTYTPYQEVSGVFGGRIVGGGDNVFGGPADAANTAGLIIIKNNYNGNLHGTWNSGIVIGANALTGTDGSALSGVHGVALSMARMHALDWHAPANGLGARLSSRVTDGTKGVGLFFSDDAYIFQSLAGGAGVLRVQHTAGAVNYLQIGNNPAGGPVVLTALGSDANINVRINPKGTGRLQVGYATTAAVNAANFTADRYLQFIDGTGNAYLIPCRASPW